MYAIVGEVEAAQISECVQALDPGDRVAREIEVREVDATIQA